MMKSNPNLRNIGLVILLGCVLVPFLYFPVATGEFCFSFATVLFATLFTHSFVVAAQCFP